MNRGLVRPVIWALIGVGIALLVIGGITATIRIQELTTAIRETQQTGSPVLLEVARSAAQAKTAAEASKAVQVQIADCLDPDGLCYKRSQRRSASAIGSINEITYYAVSCADEPGTQSLEEIQTCVIARLGHH